MNLAYLLQIEGSLDVPLLLKLPHNDVKSPVASHFNNSRRWQSSHQAWIKHGLFAYVSQKGGNGSIIHTLRISTFGRWITPCLKGHMSCICKRLTVGSRRRRWWKDWQRQRKWGYVTEMVECTPTARPRRNRMDGNINFAQVAVSKMMSERVGDHAGQANAGPISQVSAVCAHRHVTAGHKRSARPFTWSPLHHRLCRQAPRLRREKAGAQRWWGKAAPQ